MESRKLYLTAVILLVSAFSVLSQNQPPTVSKVEPPDWWANHTINPVRLLVRGANFSNARIASKNPALKPSNPRVNARGDYLFFDVAIAPNAKPGSYEFEVSTPAGKTRVPFAIRPPLDPKSNFQGITNNDVVYLIMTDRFANGDPSNDAGAVRSNPRLWHGGDLRGVIDHLDYLKELGVTAVWLTPWYDNTDEITACDKPWCPMASYHGYGATDYYGVENHFGSLADVRELVEKAHRMGIKVIQDQVANHVGYRHPWAAAPPLDDWFPPFVQNTFNNSVLLSPNSSKAERDNLLRGWFDFSLPDLNQDEPEVARYEIQNALWWIGATGIDGIRQDTIQYMPRKFIRDWSDAILRQYPRFWMVGEVFEEDSVHTAFFQGGKTGWDGIDTHLPSVFDFKLWRTSQEVFTGKKPMRALRDVMKYDGFYPNVDNVTLLANNHDTDRFMSLPGATLEGAMLHTAFVLTTRGIPQLYYGEELAMTGGHDPDNRKDFPGGFPGDQANKFTTAGRTADEQKMFDWTSKWINLRCNYVALRQGKTIDLFYDNNVYAFERITPHPVFGITGQQTSVVLAFNNSDAAKTISIKKIYAFFDYDSVKDLFRRKLKEKGLSDEEIEKQIERNFKGLEPDKNNSYLLSLLDNNKQLKAEKDGSFQLMIPPKSVVAYGANASNVMMATPCRKDNP
ncbi:MAG: cyclomaltodextrinase N-terminal domain-containing protein [Acidobacteria bacterium]|nr:cyclomaltodextrinase N-terminal domain-containing protein [Acidobacteriota bacterium]